MTQDEINKKCLKYMKWITNIGLNRNTDLVTAVYFGAEHVDFTLEDLRTLKEGYELFYKADESVPDFENLVSKRMEDKKTIHIKSNDCFKIERILDEYTNCTWEQGGSDFYFDYGVALEIWEDIKPLREFLDNLERGIERYWMEND